MIYKHFGCLEDCVHKCKLSTDNIQCENLFKESVTRDANGRFIMWLPLKFSPDMLGDSKNLSLQRFLNLEFKFNEFSAMKEQYVQLILWRSTNNWDTWLLLVLLIIQSLHNIYCMIAVFREDSVTTEIRVAFDGFAVTDSGKPSNPPQFTSFALLNNLITILVRFRQHNYVVCRYYLNV